MGIASVSIVTSIINARLTFGVSGYFTSNDSERNNDRPTQLIEILSEAKRA